MREPLWGLEIYEGEIFIMDERTCREMARSNEDYTLVVNRDGSWRSEENNGY